jgi:hypothetical protein
VVTTTTVDPNLDPYYPELGDAWGIGDTATTEFGADVAAFCLVVNEFKNLPEGLSNRDLEAIGQRISDGIYGGDADLSSLKPYMDGLFVIAEIWRQMYPERPKGLPISVLSDETARKSITSLGEVSPSCLDPKFQEWLQYKGFTEQARTLLGMM